MDFERALLLMQIIHKAAELGPKEANSIGALALNELRELDAEAKEILMAPVEEED